MVGIPIRGDDVGLGHCDVVVGGCAVFGGDGVCRGVVWCCCYSECELGAWLSCVAVLCVMEVLARYGCVVLC